MSLDDSFESVPDNAIQMITAYEKILAITDRMLEAAKNSDWEKLVALEQDCKHLTGQLIEQHSRYELSDEQQKKKIALIQEILARDAEIRAITEPWMTHLQNLLTNCNYKRKLGKTYRTDQ